MSNEIMLLDNLFSNGALAELGVQALVASADLSRAITFLQRIQLYSGGKAVKKRLVEEGHFGVPVSKEEVIDLGLSIDVLVLWRKAKALDMSDLDNVIESNDVNSDLFKRIKALSSTKDSGCAYGPSYLVYERSTSNYYEFFAGNASGLVESAKINTYMPVSQDMIEKGLTNETEPRGPKPMTLRSQLVEKGPYMWFAPKASDCLTPFNKMPSPEEFQEKLALFLKKPEVVEKVEEKETSTRVR